MFFFINPKKTAARAVMILMFPVGAVTANGLYIEPGEVYQLGAFPAESNQVATFTLSNTASNGALCIEQLKSCCAFLQPVLYEESIAPLSSTPLDVLIDAHTLKGPFKKEINFVSGGQSHRLWIEGSARPAIAISSTRIHAGETALGHEWTTNLAVAIRSDLSGRLTATTRSNIGLSAKVQGKEMLQLSIPAQQQPLRWQGTLQLGIEGRPQLPPAMIHLAGCIGGSLHPLPRKLVLSGDDPTASFTLYRKHPSPAPTAPPPLQCNPLMGISEEFHADGSSDVALQFTDDFMQRLKTEQRIPVQLRAEGCVPASLMIEYAPR